EVRLLLQRLVANKFIFESPVGGRVLHGVRKRKLQRGGEADILQHRGTQVFANAPHLLRDRFDLGSQHGRVKFFVAFAIRRQLIAKQQQVTQVCQRLIVQ